MSQVINTELDASKDDAEPEASLAKEEPSSQDHLAAKKDCEGKCQNVDLQEDTFGVYHDDLGRPHAVKRFTWKNVNKIEVQIITYGARIISIKYPDRKGYIEDIVLGYTDFSSYLRNKHLNLGGTIGRVTGVIENSTYVLHKKQHWLKPNSGNHHINGGHRGFDSRLWSAYVEGNKVIMSLSSDDHIEGYPGTVLVHATFELTAINEFKVVMEAQTTEPTIINLSNYIYLNLGGHQAGPEDIYKTILTLNCNCYTKEKDSLPTGEIMNVVHSRYDFQVPKALGKVINCDPKEGYDQNFCVNRGVDQGDAFIARLLHPKTGRMVEIYSNQPGVRLETANNWGSGKLNLIPVRKRSNEELKEIATDKCLKMVTELHQAVLQDLQKDCQNEYQELLDLITKVSHSTRKSSSPPKVPNPSEIVAEKVPTLMESGLLSQYNVTSAQENYLRRMLAHCNKVDQEDLQDIAQVLEKILVGFLVKAEVQSQDALPTKSVSHELVNDEIQSRDKSIEKTASSADKRSDSLKAVYTSENQKKLITIDSHADGRIHGKGNAIYQMHGGIAIQTQNYPNAINIKAFPNSVLNPGEIYRHSITYKFWIRAGQPAKWLRRNRDV